MNECATMKYVSESYRGNRVRYFSPMKSLRNIYVTGHLLAISSYCAGD